MALNRIPRLNGGFRPQALAASLLALLCLLAFALPTARAADQSAAAPPLEIVYIPREALPKAPDKEDAGLFLPLGDLLSLAREAERPAAADPRKTPVFCTGLELRGRLGDALTLAGAIELNAPSAEWTTTRIDDGGLPWIAQGSVEPLPTTPTLARAAGMPQSATRNPQSTATLQAFMTRVNGATWLFAKGPGRGRLPVRVMLPAPPREGVVTLALGRLYVPSRIDVALPPEIRLTAATLPARAQGDDASRTLTLWPAQGKPSQLTLRRQPTLQAPDALRVSLDRHIRAVGNALEVADSLALRGSLKAGRARRLALPAGMRLLRAEAVGADERKERATLEATSGSLVLTPLEDLDRLQFRATFTAELHGGRARLGDWGIDALAREAALTLEGSAETEPVLAELPAELRPAASTSIASRYQCDGALPALAVDLAPTRPAIPPRLTAALALAPGQGSVNAVLEITGTRRRAFLFHLPPGWLLTNLAVCPKQPEPVANAANFSQSQVVVPQRSQVVMPQASQMQLAPSLPATIQQLDSGTWSVEWDPALSPGVIQLNLRRPGAWGAPGSVARLDLPLIGIDGDRPLDNLLSVRSVGALDVRALDLAQVDSGDAGMDPLRASLVPGGDAALTLRVTGAKPAGVLEIRGRDADVRATVVTALTVGEDQARVRALIQYQVSQAPASTFRFRLPAGTGAGVKVGGEGIRESTMHPSAEGEDWTVVTQQKVTGTFPLTLEWTLAGRPGRDAIEAPRIRPLGVTAQQGFIVMESAETMQLKADARNLSEADLADIPPLPWPRDSRILGAWRYVEPAFTLSVRAEKFQPEPPLGGLVREAQLATSVAPEGAFLTRATYSLMPMSDRQFFEVKLPGGARLWSVLVDGKGVKPGRKPGAEGEQTLLVPLPTASGHAGDIKIEVLYREESAPLTQASRLALAGPALGDPVNKTTWKLSLPQGFEYLAYGGSMVNTATAREPLAAFLRTAYYPDRLVFIGLPLAAIVLGTLALLFVYLVVRRLWLARRAAPAGGPVGLAGEAGAMNPVDENAQAGGPSPEAGGPPPLSTPPPPATPRQGSGCFGTAFLVCFIIGVVLVLAAIAVPNFLEAQTRSKTARVKSDMRTIMIAMESYFLDQNSYPSQQSTLWQGPVKYLPNEYYDPYAPSPNTPLHYLSGPAAVQAGKAAGLFSADLPDNYNIYLIYSVGPDQKDDGAMICYDPTNGAESAGDIIRVKDGCGPAPAAKTFSELRKREGVAGGKVTNGAEMQAQSAPMAQQPRPAAGPGSQAQMQTESRLQNMAPVIPSDVPSPVVSNETESKGRSNGLRENAALDSADKEVDGDLDLIVTNGIAANDWVDGADRLKYTYDPSNGTSSRGDVVREKDGLPSGPTPAPSAENHYYADQRAAQGMAGGMIARDENPNDPTASPEERLRRQRALINKRINAKPASPAPGGGRGGRGGMLGLGGGFAPPPVQREAGLLSLGIELPEGGVARSFETLGGDARINIRLLAEDRFLRWNFIVWVAAFLGLAGLWLASPRLWRFGFVAGIGLTLLVPVLFRSAWVVFFNTAFQGILFSAVVPLAAWVLARLHARFVPPAGGVAKGIGLIALAVLVLSSGQIRAAEAPAPTRILVPYDEGRGWNALGQNPLALIGKGDFTRLWSLAHPEQLATPKPGAALTELRLEGAFDPETSSIRGTLTLLARNPSDTPTSLPLRLKGLALEGATSDPPGAAVDTAPTSTGLALRLAAGWTGSVRARLLLRCESQGSTGRMRITLPEAASGFWRIDLPWRGAVAEGAAALACVAETTSQGTTLTGPARPGLLELAWRSGPPTQAGVAAPGGWQCVIDNAYSWTGLTSAAWESHMTLSATGTAGALPAEVRFPLDGRVRIFSASGEGLRATRVADGQLILTLTPVRETTVVLQGAIAAEAEASHWTIPGLRAPKGVPALMHLYLYASDALELISIEPQKLESLGAAPPRPGFSSRSFQTADPDWRLALDLARPAPAFAATVRELFLPGAGYLRQAALIELAPRRGSLAECRLDLPAGVRVTRLTGEYVAGWTQSGATLLVTFSPSLARPTELMLEAVRDLAGADGALPPEAGRNQPGASSLLRLVPISVRGAAETRRLAAMLVSPDSELQEVAMAGAVPRVPDANDRALITMLSQSVGVSSSDARVPENFVRQLYGSDVAIEQVLRSWTLPTDKPLEARLAPLPANALVRVYNRVTLASGLQTLDCTLSAEPRRGRLRQVEALLLLGTPDPAAATRLQASGHVRHLRTEPAGDRALRLQIELDAPQEKAVSIQLHYARPADTDGTAPLRLALAEPAAEAGSRAFLMLRSEVEGELAPADLAGARQVDPAQVGWPAEASRPGPADRVFELEAAARETPSFGIRRHVRDEALKAFIDVLRHRVIVAASGLERHELELVLQNQSLQFLKVALPAPRRQVTLYETQVAGRVVKAAFADEGGREVLMIPLIRTGLLDPELTVRVAYTVSGLPAMDGGGSRRQAMPEVLGGVPVAQSTLILMLPTEFRYSEFQGTLNRVELVDLEVDETLRATRQLEKLSEKALATKGETQVKMLGRLNKAKEEAAERIKNAKQTNSAYIRNYDPNAIEKDKSGWAREQRLSGERGSNLAQAEQSLNNMAYNTSQLQQAVVNKPAPVVPQATPTPTPAPAARGWVEFPRSGEVYAFRQLQGTGYIQYAYAARQKGARGGDLLAALLLTGLAAVGVTMSGRLFATRRRVASVIVAVCLAAILAKTALDLAIPGLVLGVLLWFGWKPRPPAVKPEV